MGHAGAVDIIGRGCRLPGASGTDALWQVLVNQRCTVGEIGDDRWAKARFYNPRQGERGKSYTFAAGVLDDIWGFDPAVFSLSPREAEHMDPQQRVLLQVVWEALEDAGVRPSELAGRPVGVYVGVSSPDAATRHSHDVGATDAYTMTGSTLSLAANRISYVFDWRGPSLSIDTACSSSLVAMSEALQALQSGRIDTAVVAGVNILLSPFPFLGFSAARMLAPDGRCRPFSADGQGYVRAEGAVALVLRRREAGRLGAGRRYAEVVAAGVNSDGRTAGISLPSADSQAALLAQLYDEAGVDPEDLAFVEAHGTGTRAGDPAEAEAIGRVLGRRRMRPLPIGSIKSNIGHLEPAAGLAGVLKALLAFEYDLLPASLHCATPNPAIPFSDLNIEVARAPIPLTRADVPRLAGISAFGFGGTNAHVILREARETASKPQIGDNDNSSAIANDNEAGGPAALTATPRVPNLLMLTAQCRPGLEASAIACLDRLDGRNIRDAAGLSALASAYVHYREHLPERVVISAANIEEARAGLSAFLDDRAIPSVVTARASGCEMPVAFVYAGNGSQWAGMGQLAYTLSAPFRSRFDALSRRYAELAGWSLSEELIVGDLIEKLASARIAQPLLFAIQAALTDVLSAAGLRPDIVIGHSVGEVAAAYAAGALDETSALRVIAARSSSQELARGLGTMAAVALSEEAARHLIDDNGLDAVEIGAVNSPSSVTLSGPRADVERAAALALSAGARAKVLELDYPFHSALLDCSRRPLLSDLADIRPAVTRIAMISTVTGREVDGPSLDASYWWRNVRDPVRFGDAVVEAARRGARAFIEISPRAILRGYLTESLGELSAACAVLGSLGPNDDPASDPVRGTLARALARGARCDVTAVFGPPPPDMRVPHYPWQNTPLDFARTPEAGSMARPLAIEHRYLGWRERAGAAEWINHLDTALFPELADHRIGGQVYVPGAVLAEMAIAAATLWLGTSRAEIHDLDILAPLVLAGDHIREVRTSLDPESRSLTIASRRRLSDEAWQTHVSARFGGTTSPPAAETALHLSCSPDTSNGAAAFYARARRLGLDYGPAFQRLGAVTSESDGHLHVEIGPRPDTSPGLLDPVALDVALHGLLDQLLAERDSGEVFLPVRIGRLVLDHPQRAVTAARIAPQRRGVTSARCDIRLLDASGATVARLFEVGFKSASLRVRRPLGDIVTRTVRVRKPLPGDVAAPHVLSPPAALMTAGTAAIGDLVRHEEARLLVEAAAQRSALDALSPLLDGSGTLTASRLATSPPALLGLVARLECAGIAARSGADWRVNADAASVLPPLDALIHTLAADHPEWWPEFLLIARAAELWSSLASGAVAGRDEARFTDAMLEAFHVASPRGLVRVEALLGAVRDLAARATHNITVMEIGYGSTLLTRPLARLLASRGGHLVTVEPDDAAAQRLRSQVSDLGAVAVVTPEHLSAEVSRIGHFDLVVSAGSLDRFSDLSRLLATARGTTTMGIPVLVAAPIHEAVHDVVLGLAPAASEPIGELPAQPSAAAGSRRLEASGLIAVTTTPVAQAGFFLLGGLLDAATLAGADARRTPRIVRLVAEHTDAPFAAALAGEVRRLGGNFAFLGELAEAAGEVASIAGIELVADFERPVGGADHCAELGRRLSFLTALLQKIGDQPGRLWIIARGADDEVVCPVAVGLRAFARTAMNELAMLDVRVVDFADGLDATMAAARFCRLLAEPGEETELLIDTDHFSVERAISGEPILDPISSDRLPDGEAIRLELSSAPGRARLGWQRIARRAPSRGEVEIEVRATGLNFRDVMWSMGLLPEEALEHGFAGPTLGFECAGLVTRCGPDVTGLAPGQMVMAFAPAAFASHVTVPSIAVAPVPAGMPPEAAATLPVAFITAAYALDHLARVEADERVLIHGGAGGVGLAALQIAKARGAEVFVTAGSPEKRSLLAMLGADHVLDSRSLAFADEVLAATGGMGVDVVLNSLAGEAMERSLGLVTAFGRFVELGKRDFFANTRIGLRPFRRNVSYFGVDADQLLAQKPQLARRLLSDLTEQLAAGTFVALPWRRFEACDVGHAFRLMQQSGHVGKIVVAAPRVEDAPSRHAAGPFTADPSGAHVVVGGLGGFGLATARWLVDHGARRLVLVGRSGRPAPDCEAALAALLSTGADVAIEATDIADAGAVAAMLDRVRAKGPIRGIVHAAMVLDDDLITRLTPERIDAVLAPKVAGAAHTDRLTRADELQYFVLYSSVTALIGNPGQAAYVAANGYLEGLARRRRTEGLPALAVGWGGITDVGYLARHAAVGRAIEHRTGASVFTADEALDALGELMALGRDAPAALTVAPLAWSSLAGQLRGLATPLFADLTGRPGHEATQSAPVELVTEIATMTESEARARVAHYLAEEIARILRMAPSDMRPSRSLSELGMDSLMALELRLAVQRRLGAEIPLAVIAGGATLSEVAARITVALRDRNGKENASSTTVGVDLAHQHVSALSAGDLAPLLHKIGRRGAGMEAPT